MLVTIVRMDNVSILPMVTALNFNVDAPISTLPPNAITVRSSNCSVFFNTTQRYLYFDFFFLCL